MSDYIVSNNPELVDDTIDKVQELKQTTGTSTTEIMSQKAVTDELDLKVDEISGKGLSTEDYTTEEKAKLAGIESEANKTVVVQATGTSEEDVMSQKATTNMIINPDLTATKPRVRINSDDVDYVGSNTFGTVLIDAKPSSTGIEAKIGDGSIVIGGKLGATAKDMATIVGVDATAGVGSVAIGGGGTSASGESSIAIRGAAVSSKNSIAMGLDSTIDTGADYSVALGSSSYITGMCSQSIGTLSKALSNFAVALGYVAQLSSDSAYSVVLGAYSKATVPSVVSVGDGTSNADYGTRRIVSVKDPTGNQDAATKNYVDVTINNAVGAVLGGSY